MAEGRRLHGDGMENIEDYIEERATYGTDTNEIAEENRVLEQELHDLQNLEQQRGTTTQQPNIDALTEEAQLPSNQLDLRSGTPNIDPTASVNNGIEQMTPQQEARQSITGGITDQTGMGNLKP